MEITLFYTLSLSFPLVSFSVLLLPFSQSKQCLNVMHKLWSAIKTKEKEESLKYVCRTREFSTMLAFKEFLARLDSSKLNKVWVNVWLHLCVYIWIIVLVIVHLNASIYWIVLNRLDEFHPLFIEPKLITDYLSILLRWQEIETST